MWYSELVLDPTLQKGSGYLVKNANNLNQSAAKKLPSFIKLVSPFRKPINHHLWWSLEEFLGCMVMVEMSGMKPNKSSK